MEKARIAVLAVIVIIASLFLVGLLVHLEGYHERTQIAEAQQRAKNSPFVALAAEDQYRMEHPLLNRLDHLWEEALPGFVVLGGPLVGLGLISLWVMRPGRVRLRLHGVTQVAMTGWTVFIALRFATGEWSPALLWAEIARAIALWVAGIVLLLMVFFWTHGPQG